jgi:pimeloyl-ACP methyl ester carboxylesterase
MTISSFSAHLEFSRISQITSVLLSLSWLAGCSPGLESSIAQVSRHAVEIVDVGEGEATVVFEAGWGNDWTPWDSVAAEVAVHTRVFAYSRPGYGRSEWYEQPRDVTHIVDNLREILVAQSVAPPYVLVGHSFGGAYMELYAKAHPEEVAGLVLIDPRHRSFSAVCTGAGFEGCVVPDALLATLPPFQVDEYIAYQHVAEEIGPLGAFGTYPVRVLTATEHGFVPEVEHLWQAMLGDLANEAVDGVQDIFQGAGHNLQLERPHEVAEVILSLVQIAETDDVGSQLSEELP